MLYFPQPYPNEILYSIIARYKEHSLFTSTIQVYNQLFSKGYVSANLIFPRHLEQLSNNVKLFLPYNTQAIIDKFTIIPCYKKFLSPEKYNQIIASLKYDDDKRVDRVLAYFQKLQNIKKIPEYCPQCFQEDLQSNGEGYWHLEHQLPGMIICLKHDCFLCKPELNLNLIDGKSYIPAIPSFCKEFVIKKNTNDILTLISQKLRNYLNKPIPIQNDFYERACEKGFVKRNNILAEKLTIEVEKYFSSYLLSLLLKESASLRKSLWLRRSISGELKLPFPLGTALIESFFENYTPPEAPKPPFGNGPWVCINKAAYHFGKNVITDFNYKSYFHDDKNHIVGTFSCSCGMVYSKSCTGDKEIIRIKAFGTIWEQKLIELIKKKELQKNIAFRLGVASVTIVNQANKLNIKHNWKEKETKHRKRASNHSSKLAKREAIVNKAKERWTLILKENDGLSIKEIKENFSFKTEYYYLRQYAKEWVNQINKEYKKKKQSTTSLRWKKRDVLALSELKQQYQLLEKSPPKMRVSKKLLISVVKLKHTFISFQNLNKLPLTNHFLFMHCESKFNYYKRRVRRVVQEMNDEDKVITPSAVGLKTKLSYPIHPEVREIIENPFYEPKIKFISSN